MENQTMTIEEIKALEEQGNKEIELVIVDAFGQEIKYSYVTPREILADLKKWTNFK